MREWKDSAKQAKSWKEKFKENKKEDEGNTQDKKSKHPQVFETVGQDFDGLSRVLFKCSHYIVVYWHDRFKSIIIRGPPIRWYPRILEALVVMVLHRSCCRCSTRGDYGISSVGFCLNHLNCCKCFFAYVTHVICLAFVRHCCDTCTDWLTHGIWARGRLSQRRHQNPGEVKTMCWCVLLLIRPFIAIHCYVDLSFLIHLVAFC